MCVGDFGRFGRLRGLLPDREFAPGVWGQVEEPERLGRLPVADDARDEVFNSRALPGSLISLSASMNSGPALSDSPA